MRRRLSWLDVLVLGLLCVCIGMSLAEVEFYSRGEGREALNALSVLKGGWLVPRGYGGDVASKPPLFHWMIAAFSLPFGGITEFSARIPSLLAALAVGALVFRTVAPSRRWSVVLILMSSFEWVRAGVSCRVDMLHAATLSGALLLWPSLRSRATSTGYKTIAVGGLLTAASVLTKGPVALLLSVLVFTVWYWVDERSHGVSLKQYVVKAGLWVASASLIAGLWYGAALFFEGGALWQKVWSENVGRFTSTMESVPHRHGVLYLAVALGGGLLPWSLILLASVWTPQKGLTAGKCWLSALRDLGLRRSIARVSNWWRGIFGALPALDRYAVVVGATIFLFYCIPGSKRGVYLLAGYPFYAILLGRWFERFISSRSVRPFERLFGGAAVVMATGLFALSTASLMVAFVVRDTAPLWIRRGLSLLSSMGIASNQPLRWFALAFGLGYGLYTWYGSGKYSPSRVASDTRLASGVERMLAHGIVRASKNADQMGIIRCLTCVAAMVLLVQVSIQAPVSGHWSERLIADKVREVVPVDAGLVSWHREFYGASLYAGRPILPARSVPQQGEYCILLSTDLEALRAELPPPLQPIFIGQIVRGLGGSDIIIIVRIEPPGSGLGSV